MRNLKFFEFALNSDAKEFQSVRNNIVTDFIVKARQRGSDLEWLQSQVDEICGSDVPADLAIKGICDLISERVKLLNDLSLELLSTARIDG